MNGSDAAGELRDTVVDYCKGIKQDPPEDVDRVNMRGDGNLGGCQIRFDRESDLNEIGLWGGHQFSMSGGDADYGPAEFEMTVEGRGVSTKQINTFGPGDDFDGRSDLEWAAVDGRTLQIRQEHSKDNGETIELSL